MKRCILLCLGWAFALALVMSAHAQPGGVGPGFIGHDPGYEVGWPGDLLATMTAGWCGSGDFDGDGQTDIAMLSGSHPVIMLGPGMYQAFVESTELVDSLAVLPGGATHGADALVAVNDLGLIRLQLDATTLQFKPAVVERSAWADSLAVVTGYDESVGYTRVFGVGADGVTVRSVSHAAGLAFLGDDASFVASSPVADMVPCRFDANPGLEIALLCDGGVFVHEPDDEDPVTSYPAWHAGGALTAMRSDVIQGLDELAWLTPNPNQTNHLLYVLGATGIDGPVVLALPDSPGGPANAIDPVSLDAGDVDLDGDDDLAVARRGCHHDIVLLNRNSSSPRFSTSEEDLLGVAVTPAWAVVGSAEQGVGRLIDFDRDGALDYVRMIDVSAKVVLRELLPFPNDPPGGDLAPDYDDVFIGGTWQYVPGNPTARLDLDIAGSDFEFVATHVEVTVFSQDDPITQGPTWVTGLRSTRVRFDLDPTGGQVIADPRLPLDVPADGDCVCLARQHRYLIVEYLLIDDGVVVDSSGPFAAAFVAQCDTGATYDPSWPDRISALPGYNGWLEVSMCGPNGPTAPATVGAISPLIRIDLFAPTDPPRKGALDATVDAESQGGP